MLSAWRPTNSRTWANMKRGTPWAKARIGNTAYWSVMWNDRAKMPTSHWTLKSSWRKHRQKSDKNFAKCPIQQPKIHMPPSKRRLTPMLFSDRLIFSLEILGRKEIWISHVTAMSSRAKPLVSNFNLMEMRNMISSMQTMSVDTVVKRKRTFSLKVDRISCPHSFSSSFYRTSSINSERFLAHGLARECLGHCDDHEHSRIRSHQMLSLLADGGEIHPQSWSIWDSKREIR